MDERSQKVLDAILAKDPSQITEEDKAILRARWSYVGKNSRARFADILQEKPQQPEVATITQEQPQNEKKNSADLSQHPADQDQDEEDTSNGDQDTDEA